jgi:hypothetical protein
VRHSAETPDREKPTSWTSSRRARRQHRERAGEGRWSWWWLGLSDAAPEEVLGGRIASSGIRDGVRGGQSRMPLALENIRRCASDAQCPPAGELPVHGGLEEELRRVRRRFRISARRPPGPSPGLWPRVRRDCLATPRTGRPSARAGHTRMKITYSARTWITSSTRSSAGSRRAASPSGRSRESPHAPDGEHEVLSEFRLLHPRLIAQAEAAGGQTAALGLTGRGADCRG